MPLTDFLELVAGSLPELWGNTDVPRGVYLLAVANAEPAPGPHACSCSALHCTPWFWTPGPVGVFHASCPLGSRRFRLASVGRAPRSWALQRICQATVFTYNKNLCQQICRDLLCVLASASEATACAEHPLFREDLVHSPLTGRQKSLT